MSARFPHPAGTWGIALITARLTKNRQRRDCEHAKSAAWAAARVNFTKTSYEKANSARPGAVLWFIHKRGEIGVFHREKIILWCGCSLSRHTAVMRKVIITLCCCLALSLTGVPASPAAGITADRGLPAVASSAAPTALSSGKTSGLRDFLYWPTGHPTAVPRKFDPPAQKWLAGHRGIDLKVSPGQTVFAATDATVLYAGNLAGRPVISLEDTTGRRYTYEPVEPSVAVGDDVTRGQAIGTALGGHCSGGDCLHFGVKDGPDGYVDPLRLLGGRIRLFPVH